MASHKFKIKISILVKLLIYFGILACFAGTMVALSLNNANKIVRSSTHLEQKIRPALAAVERMTTQLNTVLELFLTTINEEDDESLDEVAWVEEIFNDEISELLAIEHDPQLEELHTHFNNFIAKNKAACRKYLESPQKNNVALELQTLSTETGVMQELLSEYREKQNSSFTEKATEINGLVDTNSRLVFLILLLVVVMVLVFFLFVRRDIIAPIHRIMLVMDQVSRGDLLKRIKIDSTDEIGDLATTFNKMTQELKIAKEKMLSANLIVKNYSQALEYEVEERTKELRDTQAQMIQSSKMAAMGELGAGVAHELNNPLSGILGYAQLTLKKIQSPSCTTDTIKHYIETIEKESTRCKRIVANLLKFSRKSIPGTHEPLNINEVVEGVISLFGNQLTLKNIRIIKDFQPDLVTVSGLVNELQQVFTNLIMNAQQAIPEDGELRIITRNTVDEKNPSRRQVEIEFTDTGPGIPQENLPKIFEAFFTTKLSNKGTGLGLSISYQIIQQHKGTIRVTSEKGKGTTFIITLPAAV